MGFAIVHMTKIKAGGVGGIQSHNNREKPPKTNPDIDMSKTNENLHLVSCDNYRKTIKEAIDHFATETKTVRKDAVVMCSFIVTSDEKTMKAMSPSEQREFFEDSVKWFANRYGAENLVNATVHYDEKTPHMHVGLVPIKDGRLSCKTLFDKKEMTSIQTEFVRQVAEKYGLERGKEGSERTHLSEQRFKLEMAKQQEQQEMARANKAAEYARKTLSDVKEAEKHIETLKNARSVLEGQIDALEREIKGKVLSVEEMRNIKPEKTFTGAIKGVSLEDIENLKKTAMQYHSLKNQYDNLDHDFKRAKELIPTAQERVDSMRDKKRLEQLEKAFKVLPDNIRERLIPSKSKSKSMEHER